MKVRKWGAPKLTAGVVAIDSWVTISNVLFGNFLFKEKVTTIRSAGPKEILNHQAEYGLARCLCRLFIDRSGFRVCHRRFRPRHGPPEPLLRSQLCRTEHPVLEAGLPREDNLVAVLLEDEVSARPASDGEAGMKRDYGHECLTGDLLL